MLLTMVGTCALGLFLLCSFVIDFHILRVGHFCCCCWGHVAVYTRNGGWPYTVVRDSWFGSLLVGEEIDSGVDALPPPLGCKQITS